MDDATKELLHFQPHRMCGSEGVFAAFAAILLWYGKPRAVRSDNGSGLSSMRFQSWMREAGVAQRFIQPGKPQQNGMVESLNSRIRDEVLNENRLTSLRDAELKARELQRFYNDERPNGSIGILTSSDFRRRMMVVALPRLDLRWGAPQMDAQNPRPHRRAHAAKRHIDCLEPDAFFLLVIYSNTCLDHCP